MDEPQRAVDELRHEDDLAARGRAIEELLDVDVIDYVFDYANRLRCPNVILYLPHQCVEW